MAKLLLVRHGRTKLYQADRFWGSTDVTLSDTGIRQAEAVRDRLAGEKIKAIYCSKLSRARLTAEIIASGHGLEPQVHPELDELNFGFVEGLTFGEITRLHPELAQELIDWNPNPAFPSGETLTALNERLQPFITRLEKHKQKETVLVVSHAGPLRLLVCNLLGISIDCWRKIQVDQGSVSLMETYPQGAVLRLLNDLSHLKS